MLKLSMKFIKKEAYHFRVFYNQSQPLEFSHPWPGCKTAGHKMLMGYFRAGLIRFVHILIVFPAKNKPNTHTFGLCGLIDSFREGHIWPEDCTLYMPTLTHRFSAEGL